MGCCHRDVTADSGAPLPSDAPWGEESRTDRWAGPAEGCYTDVNEDRPCHTSVTGAAPNQQRPGLLTVLTVQPKILRRESMLLQQAIEGSSWKTCLPGRL